MKCGFHCLGSMHKWGLLRKVAIRVKTPFLLRGGECWGDRGTGASENRGREGYGRRERKGREVGVPKGLEAGEIGGNYATLHNILQSKKGKREEAKKKGAGAGIARYGRREVWTPCPPPPQGRWAAHQVSKICDCTF